MSDFRITFERPWFLFCLIPLVAVVVFSFFRAPKKFRYNLNRILSAVLGLITAFSASMMVSGVGFSYEKKNDKNEIMILVDGSFSNEASKNKKDELVKSIIRDASGKSKVGVAIFGYDVTYALPLTDKTEGAFEKYAEASSGARTDASATDIAAAIEFAKDKFTNPETSKIVLISDGIQTDGDAAAAVASAAVAGVKVDVNVCKNPKVGSETMISGFTLPDVAIIPNESVQSELSVLSSVKSDVKITFYDNGEEISSEYKSVVAGTNSIFLTHAFKTSGLHELKFVLASGDDEIKENDEFYSYVYIDAVNRLLILEKDGESQNLKQTFEDNYDVEIRNISDAPATVSELRNYDQVVLMNIANADMPEGFDEILNEYVSVHGGGLLTVGGVKTVNGETVANTYDRNDMADTLYQEMLPVSAEDYTPPIAVALVIDVSGSMGETSSSGKTYMDEAKAAAKEGLKSLDSRDYVGIVTFGTNAKISLQMTPVSERRKIESAIDKIDFEMTGTLYSPAMEKAGVLLGAVTKVNKKHIIFISDGAPSGGDSAYTSKTEANKNAGITTSCISYTGAVDVLENIAVAGGGKNYVAVSGAALAEAIRRDLSQKEIREFVYEKFTPEVGEFSSSVFSGVDTNNIPSLDGFFGTKLKKNAHSYLVGEYGQPVYAEWTYGNGKVGSFACDLNGYWSSDFISDDVGKKLITNVINGLFPLESVKEEKIEIVIDGDNFATSATIYAKTGDGENLSVKIEKLGDDASEIYSATLDDFTGSRKFSFETRTPGIYGITAVTTDGNGNVIAQKTVYKAFSYSSEYNPFLAENDVEAFLKDLADSGGGNVINSSDDVLKTLTIKYAVNEDPRSVFAIIAIITLLADVAIRKFKLPVGRKRAAAKIR